MTDGKVLFGKLLAGYDPDLEVVDLAVAETGGQLEVQGIVRLVGRKGGRERVAGCADEVYLIVIATRDADGRCG